MRILIIGGTRFMGPYVVEKLQAKGHEVSIFHRGKTTSSLPAGVKEIYGDRMHLRDYVDELRQLKPEVVLDMVVWNAENAQELMQTFAGSARRVVVASSQDVYAAFGRVNGIEEGPVDPAILTEDAPLRQRLYPHRGESPRAEDDPDRWRDTYDKIPAEQVALNYPGLPGTILRLPAVYGPNDHQHRMFQYLKRMLDKRPTIVLEEKEAGWRWTQGYVENVADALVLAVTDERASGRIYNVGEPLTLSLAERVAEIAKAADWHGTVVTIPASDLPKELCWGINAEQDVVADSSRIRHELGYREQIDLDEAFRRTIAWESDNPPAKVNAADFDYAAEDAVILKSVKQKGANSD